MERGPSTFAPRKALRARAARSTAHNTFSKANEHQLNLQYFTQLLDIDTICNNALRSLRMDEEPKQNFIDNLQTDEWKYKFDFPVTVRY